MREIKFRALCVADSKKAMLYFGVQQFDNGLFAWPNPDNIHHVDEYLSPLMQYTGLKDKNDKEIYEGDIVANGQRYKGAVAYRQDKARFDFQYKQSGFSWEQWMNGIDSYFASRELEVIGNIYENPELLTP